MRWLFTDVFGDADSPAQHLYDLATEDAPGSVDDDLTRRGIARKAGYSTDAWREHERIRDAHQAADWPRRRRVEG